MPTFEEFCTVKATMSARMLGKMPGGTRLDFPFEGTATSKHWEGERPVRGIDYVTVRSDGHMDLDIRATIGEKRETIAYRGTGVSIAKTPTEAMPQELLTFQTGNEEFGWLNTRVGVGLGAGEAGAISLTIYLIAP
jgi:hypothetical protein